MDTKLENILETFKKKHGKLLVLTGAGISVDSGLPTFRGGDGYWTVGSVNHQYMEVGTWRFFNENPYESWRWFLYRRGVCSKAKPNESHYLIAKLEEHYVDRFHLITQNIDNLHLHAGNSKEKTIQIHGDIHKMRCSVNCTNDIYQIPPQVVIETREEQIKEENYALLKCPRCNSLARGHVLWWDESYNEEFYRSETANKWATEVDLLLIIGTSASANVSVSAFYTVKDLKNAIIDINPNYSPLGDILRTYHHGFWCRGTSKEYLPQIVDFLCD